MPDEIIPNIYDFLEGYELHKCANIFKIFTATKTCFGGFSSSFWGHPVNHLHGVVT